MDAILKYDMGKVLVNNYAKDDVKVYIETRNRVKVLDEYLELKLSDRFKDDLEINPILLTLNHDPHIMTCGRSWEVIEESRMKILNKLLEEESIVYALSTIEIHTKKGLTKKGKDIIDERIKKNLNNVVVKGNTKISEGNLQNQNTNKKVKKMPGKASQNLLKLGEKAILDLNKKYKGNVNMNITHKYIMDIFRNNKDITKNPLWNDNSIHDKIRLIIAFYDMINGPSEAYRTFTKLFSLDEVDIGQDWIEIVNQYNFLIDDILTLEGYPHLHIAIGVMSAEGEYLSNRKIYSMLYDLHVLDDIQVDEKKGKKKYLGSISYVLKNNKTDIVKESLNGSPIIKGYVRLDDIVSDMKGLASKTLANGKTKKMVEMELRYIKTDLAPMSASTKYEVLTSFIIGKMKEGDFVICEGKIYKKRPGSRMSYSEYMDIEDFYDNITQHAKHQRFANKHKPAIISRMKSRQVKIEGITEPEGLKIVFPKISMDKENVWIECKDFFFSVLTGMIVRSNTKYYSYHYCDWLSLDELPACLRVQEERGLWTNILKNSNLKLDTICSEIYRLIALPQVPKGGVWHGHGASNSGKSTLLKPFLNIFPPDQIGTIKSSIGRFDLYSVRDKAIIQMEEISPYELDREEGLKLLGREPMKVEKKHGGSDRALILGRQVYTSNEEDIDLGDMVNKGFSRTLEQMRAYDNRIVNMRFIEIQETLIKASSEIIDESALVVMMCGYYYFDAKFNNSNNGEILDILQVYPSTDDIESKIKKELDLYNSYYKGSNKKPTIITENREYIEENKVNIRPDGSWDYNNPPPIEL